MVGGWWLWQIQIHMGRYKSQLPQYVRGHMHWDIKWERWWQQCWWREGAATLPERIDMKFTGRDIAKSTSSLQRMRFQMYSVQKIANMLHTKFPQILSEWQAQTSNPPSPVLLDWPIDWPLWICIFNQPRPAVSIIVGLKICRDAGNYWAKGSSRTIFLLSRLLAVLSVPDTETYNRNALCSIQILCWP